MDGDLVRLINVARSVGPVDIVEESVPLFPMLQRDLEMLTRQILKLLVPLSIIDSLP